MNDEHNTSICRVRTVGGRVATQAQCSCGWTGGSHRSTSGKAETDRQDHIAAFATTLTSAVVDADDVSAFYANPGAWA